MFAILISQDNVPEILRYSALPQDQEVARLSTYLSIRRVEWYYVTGYRTGRGVVEDSAILPAYVIEEKFQYDTEKIKTDWDQIVRK